MSQWIYKARARARAEDGISLIELMVSIFILAIALTAFAQGLIQMLQTTTGNEQRVTATSVAQQYVEQLFTIHWEFAALYEDEIAAAGGDMERWRTRISAGQVEGASTAADIATRPADTDRNSNVPTPTDSTVIGNTTYTVDRYITWVDRDGVSGAETKRFTTWVQWIDRFGNLVDAEFTAERTPTQEEVPSSDTGLAILQFIISPQNVELAPDDGEPNSGNDGEPLGDVTLLLRASGPLTKAEATYTIAVNPVYDESTGELLSVEEQLVTWPMQPASPFEDLGYTTWTLNLRDRDGNDVTDSDLEAFFNGINDFRVDGEGTDGAVVFDTEATTMAGGPFGESVDPSGVSSEITNMVASSVAACKSTGNLAGDVTIKIYTRGVDDTNGTVEVKYDYWLTSNGNDRSETTIPAPGSKFAGNSDNGTWTATITPADNQFFKKNQKITITGVEASATEAFVITATVTEDASC